APFGRLCELTTKIFGPHCCADEDSCDNEESPETLYDAFGFSYEKLGNPMSERSVKDGYVQSIPYKRILSIHKEVPTPLCSSVFSRGEHTESTIPVGGMACAAMRICSLYMEWEAGRIPGSIS